MPLPLGKMNWPPSHEARRYDRMHVSATWYAGDPRDLAALYGGDVPRTERTRESKRLLNRVYDWYWGQNDPAELDDKMHLPVAQDIAQMSSELLFAASPQFVVQPIVFDTEGKVPPEHALVVAATQRRLDKILRNCKMDALLPAAAETCAALGSVALRIGYDAATMSMPVVSRVDGDAILPEYSFGQLTALTFWRVVGADEDTIWRHLERHEAGRVLHGLYRGTGTNLGEKVALDQRVETAWLADAVDAEGALTLVDKRMSAAAIPNVLPDPLDRGSFAGRSDYSPGVLTVFDAIDKAMTSWMRDLDDGRSRLLVADYMLESKGSGSGVGFDSAQHLFTKLKMQPGDKGDPPIDQVQFAIRVDEHMRTVDYLLGQAVKLCGYNTESEIGANAGDMTATEYMGRARRSMNTRAKKLRYWQEIETLVETLLYVDADVFESQVVPLPVRMEVPPPVQTSAKMLAETVEIVARAKAASIEVMVRMLHPDWDDQTVDEEVVRIRDEQSLADPNASIGSAVAGDMLPVEDVRDATDTAAADLVP